MSRHTPGPWRVHTKPVSSGCRTKVECSAGYTVAEAFSSPSCSIPYKDLWAEAEDNAQLIAIAPELFDIARRVSNIGLHTMPKGESPCRCSRCEMVKEAQALIPKVTGDTT